MDLNLNNKKILITGASKGLGAVAARALAKEGATLVLIARSAAELEKVKNGCQDSNKHLGLALDLSNKDDLGKGINKAKQFLSEVDVVLHAVGGGLGKHNPQLSWEELQELFTLNVSVAAEINRLIVPEMKKRGRGNLVHIGSLCSDEAVGSVGYNTVKAALAAYVRSLGREIAGSGLVATGILPGGFYAPGNAWERLEANKPEIVKNIINERLPRKRLGQAEELIPMILLLCSESASMMSGCLVPMDAGEGRTYERV